MGVGVCVGVLPCFEWLHLQLRERGLELLQGRERLLRGQERLLRGWTEGPGALVVDVHAAGEEGALRSVFRLTIVRGGALRAEGKYKNIS